MSVFWYNGQFIPLHQAIFTVLSRNVNYGDGIFETLRVNNTKIYFWDIHFERLQKGIHTLELIPDALLQDKTLLQNTILELVQKNKVKGTTKVKIQVYRADETNSLFPTSHQANTIISHTETLPDRYALTSKKTILYSDVFLHYSVLSPLKTLNRLPYILAGIYANKHKVEDAILLNTQQQCIETTHSNLFYIIGNELYTPSISSGCLEGVMRKTIMQHFKVKEKAMLADELIEVDSLFSTNVIRGISPIQFLKGINKTFDSKHPLIQEIFEFLNVL